MKTFYVYLLASQTRTLYLGVTSNLLRRVAQHRSMRVKGFSSRYKVTRLVYFETTSNAWAAIAREKQIKGWNRTKKISLIETANPGGKIWLRAGLRDRPRFLAPLGMTAVATPGPPRPP
jgi:putative endonuclease